jgi:cobalt-zinc-cadmium efflux system membrane fusion protein
MVRVSALFLVSVLASCSGASSSEQIPPSSPPSTNTNTNGMCAEHGVLEAVCTQCNPALAAVFKAKGDWCDEHGFPESFCPICRPERGGRPARDVGASTEAPADGTKVRFRTNDTARLAGLKLARAESLAASGEVSATARVVYDATRVAEVNPRVAGVVRAIRADLGARVRAGSPLAVIESASVGAERSNLSAARTRLEVAEANLARREALRAEGISAERDVLAARREREDARSEVQSSMAALGMVGAAKEGDGRYVLTSPLDGVVTQRNLTIGRFVTSELTAFEIVDPSVMWIELDVREADLPLVAVGQPVVVELDNLPSRELTAKLSYVAPAIDRRTRTAIARAPLENSDGSLRANAYGRGRIAVTAARNAIVVPRAAVQRARNVHLVFVRIEEDVFEARRVTMEASEGDPVRVVGRVAPGDEVVTDGSFLLKTETLKESIGAGCCEAE